MDIEFLLALQGLRESLGSGVEAFAAAYSEYMIYAALFACAVVYWCVEKRTGQLALLCFSLGNFLNQFVKNIACVYRPWVVDSRVVPAAGALPGATGYSFPSGHTVTAGTTLGSLAWSVRRKLPALAVVLVVLVLLEAFSRCFLGVHTPQDVIVALLESAVVVLLGSYAYSRYEKRSEHERHDFAIVVVVLVLCIVSLVIIELKSYPTDFLEGVLLVDPETMKKDCYEGVGVFAGMFLGWYCERRWVRFSTEGSITLGERIARGVVGIIITLVFFVAFDALVKMVLDPEWAKLASRLVLTFVAMFVVPLIFRPLHGVFSRAK